MFTGSPERRFFNYSYYTVLSFLLNLSMFHSFY